MVYRIILCSIFMLLAIGSIIFAFLEEGSEKGIIIIFIAILIYLILIAIQKNEQNTYLDKDIKSHEITSSYAIVYNENNVLDMKLYEGDILVKILEDDGLFEYKSFKLESFSVEENVEIDRPVINEYKITYDDKLFPVYKNVLRVPEGFSYDM